MDALLSTLHLRAKELGISHRQLARRSQIPLATVKRVFAGKHRATTLGTIQKIADGLGLNLAAEPLSSAEFLREKQARRKAENLIKQLQATSALEGQALSKDRLEDMVRKTTHELLAGSSLRLWEE